MHDSIKIQVVVPCYNEQDVLRITNKILIEKLDELIEQGKLSENSSLVYVDDGSTDLTWQIIEDLSVEYPHKVNGIKLSKNCGHQNAIFAGMVISKADAVITIDADLQDDVNVINKMVDEYINGYEIVLGARDSRKTDSFLKRITAEMYYHILSWCNIEIVFNHADFRLLGRRALDALKDYSEVNLFIRGIIPLLGFKKIIIKYDRSSRMAGVSKYPLKKMVSLAWEGITSFSTAPLRWITTFGFFVSIISFGFGIWALWLVILKKQLLPGWASIVIPMYFLGGVQLCGLGIIGEYISKIYKETKRRPRFIVEKII